MRGVSNEFFDFSDDLFEFESAFEILFGTISGNFSKDGGGGGCGRGGGGGGMKTSFSSQQ